MNVSLSLYSIFPVLQESCCISSIHGLLNPSFSLRSNSDAVRSHHCEKLRRIATIKNSSLLQSVRVFGSSWNTTASNSFVWWWTMIIWRRISVILRYLLNLHTIEKFVANLICTHPQISKKNFLQNHFFWSNRFFLEFFNFSKNTMMFFKWWKNFVNLQTLTKRFFLFCEKKIFFVDYKNIC